MNPQKRKYFAIIVHFGDPTPTDKAIASLLQSTDPPDQVIVVDQATCPYQASHPVKCLRPQQNRGYASGFNFGLGYLVADGASRADVVLCLNNDISVSRTTFADLKTWWAQEPERLALVNLPIREGAVTVYGTTLNLLSGRNHLNHNPPQRGSFANLPLPYGAALAADLYTWAQLKGLPEQYFMYWEDAALGLQARRLKIPVCVAESIAPCFHAHSQSDEPDSDKLYYLVRNGARVLQTSTPNPWPHYWRVANLARLFWHTFSTRPSASVVRAAMRDALIGQTGSRPTNTRP